MTFFFAVELTTLIVAECSLVGNEAVGFLPCCTFAFKMCHDIRVKACKCELMFFTAAGSQIVNVSVSNACPLP